MIPISAGTFAPNAVVWSLVYGVSPFSRAVEPGPHGVAVSQAVRAWADHVASENGFPDGLSSENPDLYLLVTPVDEAGVVEGELAFIVDTLPLEDVNAIRVALDARRQGEG